MVDSLAQGGCRNCITDASLLLAQVIGAELRFLCFQTLDCWIELAELLLL